MPISISHYKERKNKDSVKNNLNSFLCSKNDQYHIKNTMHKYDKATNKAKCHKLHDNATLHHNSTEKLHKCMS